MDVGGLPDRTEIAHQSRAAEIASRAIADARRRVAPGATPVEIAAFIESSLVASGATPSLRAVRAPSGALFPAAACISVNEVAVNGVPGSEPLRAGDVLTLDTACAVEGWHADAATTVTVGAEPHRIQKAARGVLDAVLDSVRDGVDASALAAAYALAAQRAGVYVIREAVLHGIGRAVHEPPSLVGRTPDPPGAVIRAGQVLAIEPVVATSPCRLVTGPDTWSRRAVPIQGAARPEERPLTAYEERTVLVERRGIRILSRIPRFV